LGLLLGGLRSATLQIVATAVLAAYVGLGGLGVYIERGVALRTYAEMLGGARVIVLLALASEGLVALVTWLRTRERDARPPPTDGEGPAGEGTPADPAGLASSSPAVLTEGKS